MGVLAIDVLAIDVLAIDVLAIDVLAIDVTVTVTVLADSPNLLCATATRIDSVTGGRVQIQLLLI